VIDVVDFAATVAQIDQDLDDAMMSSFDERPCPVSSSRPTRRLNFIRPTADRS
jgi:hypothetical protein